MERHGGFGVEDIEYRFVVLFSGIGLSREERMLMVIGEIIQELIAAHERKKDVDLNRMKSRISSKYGLDTQPRLVDIIAAVPKEAKNFLLPKLRAKPIRTASGIAVVAVMCKPHRCPHISMTGEWSHSFDLPVLVISAISLHRKYLRLLPWWT